MPSLRVGRSADLHEELGELRGKRVLIVASAGGHIVEAMRLAEVLGFDAGSRYVTFDTPQTRGLLAHRTATFVPYVPPRGVRPMLVAARRIRRLPVEDYACVFSTGSALAVSGWLAALRHGKPTVYVESLARTRGPSMTGQLLTRLPKVSLYTQHPSWSGGHWRSCPSVLGAFDPVPVHDSLLVPGRRRIFVSLGTIRPYRFDRLVERVLAITHPDDEITWQLGATRRHDLPGRVAEQLSSDEFDARLKDSDLVITQAGVGTLLRSLELGVSPITVPREQRFHEHVDDHQSDIATALHRSGLALLRRVHELGPADLLVPRPQVTSARLGRPGKDDATQKLPAPRGGRPLSLDVRAAVPISPQAAGTADRADGAGS